MVYLQKILLCKIGFGFEQSQVEKTKRDFWFMWGWCAWCLVQHEAKMRDCETIWRVWAEACDKSWSKCHHLILYLTCTSDVRWQSPVLDQNQVTLWKYQLMDGDKTEIGWIWKYWFSLKLNQIRKSPMILAWLEILPCQRRLLFVHVITTQDWEQIVLCSKPSVL